MLFRIRHGQVEVLLGHPGGPYFRQKDEGSWTIPKGLVEEGEADLDAAVREFEEETGLALEGLLAPGEDFGSRVVELGEVRYSSGKRVWAWAFLGDCEVGDLTANEFKLEWPPKSGETVAFPELDRFGWFDPERAVGKLHPVQHAFLERLLAALLAEGSGG